MHIPDLQRHIPIYTATILGALNTAGYQAYLVGGAVRDLLLNIEPGDFDITTNATPEEVLAICQSKDWQVVDNLGNNFGCVVIVLEGKPTEVTTFRGETYGEGDVHRPTATWYCQTLREDLARRDFTVNAMALDLQGNLYDYFGGQQDLEAKILRPVGIGTERYQEDALRMLRACRFVAQLGFTYVDDAASQGPCGMEGTPYYLPQTYKFPVERCARLSLERVRKEMDKLLVSPYAGRGLMLMMATGLLGTTCCVKEHGRITEVPLLPEAEHLLNLHQNPKYHIYDTWEHTLLAIDDSPRDLAIRWALVLHDLGKGMPQIRKLNKDGQPTDPGHEALSAVMAKDILTRWRYNPDFIKLVTWLVAQHMRFAPMLLTGERTLLRWVRAEANSGTFKSSAEMTDAFQLLVEVFLADMGATHAREDQKLMAEGRVLGEQVVELARKRMPVSPKDLHISGKDLLALITKEEIKHMLAYLLERVQSGNLPNEQEALLTAVRKNIQRKQKS
ncbi:CCA tRNA nucleotidyltransferase [Phascolarctobacterium sp.]|uniref:CCA tRNA nucleotidyltransferase n=1 Tax=Phascolarctobacterium sp. TaxID=2049039 RepID=UPI00386E93AA